MYRRYLLFLFLGALALSCKNLLTQQTLATPSGLQPASGTTVWSADTVTFSWSSVEDANYYHFQFSSTADFSQLLYEKTTTGTSLSLFLNGSAGKRYWRVKAVSDSIESDWSEVQTLLVLPYVETIVPLAAPGRAIRHDSARNYLVVAEDGALEVFDLSNPKNPVSLGSLSLQGNIQEVEIQGNYAYVAAGATGGIQVVDISDPTAMQVVSVYDSVLDGKRIAVQDTFLVVADGANGVLLFSVADPAAPRLMDQAVPPYPYNSDPSVAVDFVSGYLYVRGRTYLHVFALQSDSAVYIYRLSLGMKDQRAYRIGNYFLAPSIVAYYTVFILSVLNPETPDYVDRWNIRTVEGGYISELQDIDLSGTRLYAVSLDEGLSVYDVADPLQPVLIGSHSGLTSSTGVEVIPPYAYVITATGELKVVRIQP